MNPLGYIFQRITRVSTWHVPHYLLSIMVVVAAFTGYGKTVQAGSAELTVAGLQLPSHISIATENIKAKINGWNQFIKRSSSFSIEQKLEVVNSYFNQMRFIDDSRMWRTNDYWATPLQMLAVGAGDCEDFAIAKFFALKALGVPVEKLRVTYVWKYTEGNGEPDPHMVLTYDAAADAEPLVLDNLIADIKPLSQRKDLQPVYAFNTEKFWLPGEYKLDVEAGNPAQLAQWRSLGKRLKRDLALLGL